MPQMYGVVEVRVGSEWCGVILVASLVLQHCDLNGCLFGVDNYGDFRPLFADRGMPSDCSGAVSEQVRGLNVNECRASWVLWKELAEVDWSEAAMGPDRRITEYVVGEDGAETLATKWLHKRGFEWVVEALYQDPSASPSSGSRLFRRVVLRREDALVGTDFPLLMRLMACLADRFGPEDVRLVVWFG